MPAVTWNPNDKYSGTYPITLSNGNKTATGSLSSLWAAVRATASKTTGNFCFMVRADLFVNSYIAVGIGKDTAPINNYVGYQTTSWGYRLSNPNSFWHNSSATYDSGRYGYQNDVIMVAFSLPAGYVWFGINGAWNGNPETASSPKYTNVTGPVFPMLAMYGPRQCTGYFKASEMPYPLPAGFSGIEEDQIILSLSDVNGLATAASVATILGMELSAADASGLAAAESVATMLGTDLSPPNVVGLAAADPISLYQTVPVAPVGVAGAALIGSVAIDIPRPPAGRRGIRLITPNRAAEKVN